MDSSNWRVIPEHETYMINQNGVVKAIARDKVFFRKGILMTLHCKEHFLKPRIRDKYYAVCLCCNNVRKDYPIHKLVYLTFVGDIPKGMTVDHIDGNCLNNNVNNLRCVTYSENCSNPNTICKRYKKVIMVDPITGSHIKEFGSLKHAELYFRKEYKTGQSSHISDVCYGKRKTCHGYKWIWK